MADFKVLAKDIMMKYVLTVSPDMTIQELISLFVTHPVGAVPVVGDDNELLGIISEGDLLYKKVNKRIPQFSNSAGGKVYYTGFGRYETSFRKLLDTKASEIMTKDVYTAAPDTPMDDIMSEMIDRHLKVVPVVRKKHLVGMVTRHDLMSIMAAKKVQEEILRREAEADKKKK